MLSHLFSSQPNWETNQPLTPEWDSQQFQPIWTSHKPGREKYHTETGLPRQVRGGSITCGLFDKSPNFLTVFKVRFDRLKSLSPRSIRQNLVSLDPDRSWVARRVWEDFGYMLVLETEFKAVFQLAILPHPLNIITWTVLCPDWIKWAGIPGNAFSLWLQTRNMCCASVQVCILWRSIWRPITPHEGCPNLKLLQTLLLLPVSGGCTATILHCLTYPKILCVPEREERKRENGDIT